MGHQWRDTGTCAHRCSWTCRKCKTRLVGNPDKPPNDWRQEVPITLLTEHDRRGMDRKALYTCEEIIALELMLS